jgi:hypothetical protein
VGRALRGLALEKSISDQSMARVASCKCTCTHSAQAYKRLGERAEGSMERGWLGIVTPGHATG